MRRVEALKERLIEELIVIFNFLYFPVFLLAVSNKNIHVGILSMGSAGYTKLSILHWITTMDVSKKFSFLFVCLRPGYSLIKTTLAVLIVLVVSMSSSLGQTRTITDGGNWSDSNNWDSGNIANSTGEDVVTDNGTFKGNETITVDGDYVTGNIDFFDQTLTVGDNNTLTLGSQALFDGGTQKDFTADNNVTINVNSGATMIIYGDLIVNNNLTLNVVGDLIVKGDLIFNNGGDLTVDGNLTVNGTIDAGNNSTLSGTGTVTTGDCTGDPDVCDDTQVFLLPVELVFFEAKILNNAIRLTWSTATELNNDYFTIERSQDGVNFNVIGLVAGAGTTNQPQNYEFSDANPFEGPSYYRLKQTDFDGISEIFRPVYIFFESDRSNFVVYPNPLINDELSISLTSLDTSSETQMRIFTVNGDVVFEKNLTTEHSANYLEEKLNMEFLPQGCYVINLSNNKDSTSIKLLRK